MDLKGIKTFSRIVDLVGPLAVGKNALTDYLTQRHSVITVEVGEFARQLVKEATGLTKISNNKTKQDEIYDVEHALSERQVDIVLVGRQINKFRKRT